MSKKTVEPSDFVTNVKSRYRKDIIMSVPVTLMVILVPIILLGYFLLAVRLGHLIRLQDFKTAWTLLLFTMMMYVMVLVLYTMYSRLRKHAKRDREWRAALIAFAEEKGVDTTRMVDLHKHANVSETFVMAFLITFLVVFMFVWDFWAFIHYIPESYVNDVEIYIFPDSDNPVLSNLTHTLVSLIVALVTFVLIFLRVATFAYGHEQRQCEFTAEFSMKMKTVGIKVPAMLGFVKHRNIIIHLLLLMFTGGIYLMWFSRSLLKSMNDHLINQWAYEEGLIPVIESGGTEPYKYPEGYRKFDDGNAVSRQAERTFAKYLVRRRSKMPRILILAELFLLVMCANYILKLVALECEICNDYSKYTITSLASLGDMSINTLITLAMVGIYMLLLVMGVGALMGIASRKPSSWRKVTRTCITFVIPLWISELFIPATGLSNMFSFNVYLSTAILYNMLLIMLVSYSVKRHYTPVGMAVPGLLTWVRYIFVGKLDSDDNIDEEELLEAADAEME